MQDLDAIKGALDDLLDNVLHRHRNVNGAGLAQDEHGWYIKVNLTKPHKWWHRQLPHEHQGFRIRYQVIGVVQAL